MSDVTADLTADQAAPGTGAPAGPPRHDDVPPLAPRGSLVVLVSAMLLVAAVVLLGSALVTGA